MGISPDRSAQERPRAGPAASSRATDTPLLRPPNHTTTPDVPGRIPMKSHRRSRRSQFVLESLEGRIALSGMGSGLDDGAHHHRGGKAVEVRHGADDGANHDANDDKGGVKALRRGADDPAGHNANDVKNGATEVVHHHRGRSNRA